MDSKEKGIRRPKKVEDKRKLAMVRMESALGELADYSLGEFLYAALRGAARSRGHSISFLRDMEDGELYKYIEDSLDKEFDQVSENG